MTQTEPRQVVITGMGLITPIGHDLDTVWSNLVEGVSGAGPITRFDASGYATKIAAEVKGFDPTEYMDRKTARNLGRHCECALAPSRQALSMARLDPGEHEPDDVGVLVSTAFGGVEE